MMKYEYSGKLWFHALSLFILKLTLQRRNNVRGEGLSGVMEGHGTLVVCKRCIL